MTLESNKLEEALNKRDGVTMTRKLQTLSAANSAPVWHPNTLTKRAYPINCCRNTSNISIAVLVAMTSQNWFGNALGMGVVPKPFRPTHAIPVDVSWPAGLPPSERQECLSEQTAFAP
eukprot:5461219-Amphidinium_carterae.1